MSARVHPLAFGRRAAGTSSDGSTSHGIDPVIRIAALTTAAVQVLHGGLFLLLAGIAFMITWRLGATKTAPR